MTSPALYRLIYVSSATVELSLVQLNQLLQRARTKNAALEITGLLLYCDGSFLQLLEGPQGAVEQLYRSIRQDPRHTRCMVLEEGQAEQRLFPDWRMGFQLFTAAQIAELEGFSDFLAADSDLARQLAARPEQAAQLLLKFRALPGLVPSVE